MYCLRSSLRFIFNWICQPDHPGTLNSYQHNILGRTVKVQLSMYWDWKRKRKLLSYFKMDTNPLYLCYFHGSSCQNGSNHIFTLAIYSCQLSSKSGEPAVLWAHCCRYFKRKIISWNSHKNTLNSNWFWWSSIIFRSVPFTRIRLPGSFYVCPMTIFVDTSICLPVISVLR